CVVVRVELVRLADYAFAREQNYVRKGSKMNLLVGIIVGIFLALLVFGNLYLVGKQSSWKEAVKKATGDLYDAQALVGRFAYLEQERQKMKEHIQVNFT